MGGRPALREERGPRALSRRARSADRRRDDRRARSTRGSTALEALGVPCGPINRLDQVFADPQLAARGIAAWTFRIRSRATCRRSARRSGSRRRQPEYERAPPLLGEHTAAVLRERLALTDDAHRRTRRARRDRRARLTPARLPKSRRHVDAQARRSGSRTPSLAVIALAVAWRIFPLAIPLVNLDITLSRAEAREEGRAEAARLAHSRRTTRKRRPLQPRQRDAELRRARRRRQDRVRRAGHGRSLRAVLVGRADLQAGRGERSRRSASGPTARRTASAAAFRRAMCATPATKALIPLAARALGEERRDGRLEDRSRAVHAARAVAADASQRARRSRVRLSARRDAGRGAHPAAPHGRRRRARRRSRPTCTFPNRSSGGSASCAARTTRSPVSPALAAGLPVRPRRLHSRRAVARAHALARRASRARRRASSWAD